MSVEEVIPIIFLKNVDICQISLDTNHDKLYIIEDVEHLCYTLIFLINANPHENSELKFFI